MLTVTPIKAFSDNYIWCLRRPEGNEAYIVDPGDADVVLQALAQDGLELAGILITHHHFDHTGGLESLLAHRQVPVYGPQNPAITQISHRLSAGDSISVLGMEFVVYEVPGHTLDHIAFYGAGDPPLLFCGDTLFAGGCGRLFEGDASTMHASLSSLAALPTATQVYCAHEYTLANLAFAAALEPENIELQARIEHDSSLREHDTPTVPSSMALELATNPFLRSAEPGPASHMQRRDGVDPGDAVAVFAAIRGWKDNF
jgi:hydroxyacylglutathione hydrolase